MVTLINAVDKRLFPCSVAAVEFAARPGESYIIVGSASGMVLNPHTCNQGYLHTYKRVQDEFGTTKLELLHKVN